MALVKLRSRLRTEGSRQITHSDRRTNEQAIAVARRQAQSPPFIAAGTVRWRELRRPYEQTAGELDRSEGHTADLRSRIPTTYADFLLEKRHHSRGRRDILRK